MELDRMNTTVVTVMDSEEADCRLIMLDNGELIPFSLEWEEGYGMTPEEWVEHMDNCLSTPIALLFGNATPEEPEVAAALESGTIVYDVREVQ